VHANSQASTLHFSLLIALHKQGTLYNPRLFAAQLPDDAPIVLYVGAMAAGHLTIAEHPEVEEMISISEYPLSGAAAISRVFGAIENHWGIV
jgi:rRNA small subunit pseudouridine methyltransferase Nep1